MKTLLYLSHLSIYNIIYNIYNVKGKLFCILDVRNPKYPHLMPGFSTAQ